MSTREESEWAKVTYGFKTKRIALPSNDLNRFIDQIKLHFTSLKMLPYLGDEFPRLNLGWHSASALEESCMDSKSEA